MSDYKIKKAFLVSGFIRRFQAYRLWKVNLYGKPGSPKVLPALFFLQAWRSCALAFEKKPFKIYTFIVPIETTWQRINQQIY